MVLDGTKMRHVTVHTDLKIKRNRKAGGSIVSIIIEPKDKMYRISFFKSRRLGDNSSVPFGYKYGEWRGKGAFSPPDLP